MPRWLSVVLLSAVLTGCRHDEPESTPQDGAESAAAPISPEDPRWGQSQWRMGRQALAAEDRTGALEHFQSIPRDASPISLQAALEAGRLQESSGQLSQAIDAYEYVLHHQPEQYAVMGRVAELYALTGQRAEADSYLTRLVKTPELGFKSLVLLTDFERRHEEDFTRLQALERQAPDDPAVQLGLAVEEMKRGDIDSAERRLRSVVAVEPEMSTAQALLGEALLLESSTAEAVRWNRELPASVQDHPQIWYTRGLWARQLNEPSVAARCFWESIRQCPTSYQPIYQLGQVRAGLGSDVRESCAARAANIFELKENLSRVLDSSGRDEVAARKLVLLLLESGREWEAWSWIVMLQPKFPRAAWLAAALSKLRDYPYCQAPRILDSANLAKTFDLSHLPSFASLASRLEEPGAEARPGTGAGAVRFSDVSQTRAVAFVYHRGHVAGLEGIRMQETTGGGVGVFDYDSDGWPDLFLTQGEDWPEGAAEPGRASEFGDALFRNRRDGFQNQTVPALPQEDGFGQGCACGDFNNDGFADIYVANIGTNQLLINLGDGTFVDGTPQDALSQRAWTTSCLMADLNSDGAPDLFDVNYVEGPRLFQMICNENDCSPEAFIESRDVALVSLGDGRTILVESNRDGPAGGGLGVVAFRADRDAGTASTAATSTIGLNSDSIGTPADVLSPETYLSLFVANDQDPNEFLRVALTDDLPVFELNDESFPAGLALDYRGNTSACMGVAAGDVTGDGRLDLFVTNYKDEARILYSQQAGPQFSDNIAGTGLLLAGLPYIGWGTQCLDAENDGDLDLIAANGHVGYFDKPGVPDRMPTQFFLNGGTGVFHEVPPDALGSYFTRPVMGRSLAVMDWDRDGLTDVVVSLLDENAVLLKNASTDPGNWVALRLIGTHSARDAIGTVVTTHTHDRVIRRQLTAGDGFQASNERILRFGIGGSTNVDRMVVEWPSGQIQEFDGVPANVLLLLTEGMPYLLNPVRAAPAEPSKRSN